MAWILSAEGKVASEPDALIGWLRSLGYELNRVGPEAGPLSECRDDGSGQTVIRDVDTSLM